MIAPKKKNICNFYKKDDTIELEDFDLDDYLEEEYEYDE